MTRRDLALHVWSALLHQPYRWAGDDPIHGYDCSGLVLEGLKAAGLVGREADFSADQLLNGLFRAKPRLEARQVAPGCLLFWNRGSRVGHVEIVWTVLMEGDRAIITIGASGGGSATTSDDAAAREDAYIKLRPAAPGWVAALDPFQ